MAGSARWAVAGSGLVGAGYTVIAALRIDAIPPAATILAAVVAGAVASIPAALLHLHRRRKRIPARTELASFVEGLFLVLPPLLAAGGAVFALVRWTGRQVGLLSGVSNVRLLVAPLVGIAAAVLCARLASRWVDRLSASPAKAGPFAGGTAALLVVAALFTGQGPARGDDGIDAAGVAEAAPFPRLVVVAIDGLGLDLVRTYADEMPALSRFAASAAVGSVRSAPPQLSSGIWTSIATGLPPSKHRISNFEFFVNDPAFGTIPVDRLYTDPVSGLLAVPLLGAWRAGWISILPATRLHRRGTPFWKLPALGRIGLVCWPATWPVEPVSGVNVSDRWAPSKTELLFHYRAEEEHLVWPAETESRIAPFRRAAGEPPDPELVNLVPLRDEEIAAFVERQAVGTVESARTHAFSNAYYGWLNTQSCGEAARHLRDDRQPSVLAVYFEGVDLTAHVLLPDERGQVPGFSPDDSKRLAPFMAAYLNRFDRKIAWLLEPGDERTTTLVIGDHGMARQENALFGNWHSGDGVLFARGPAFPPGKELGTLLPEEVHPLLLGAVSPQPDRPAR